MPLSGRIVAVADDFDALTHDRPYKQAWPVDQAVTEIRRLSGLQFRCLRHRRLRPTGRRQALRVDSAANRLSRLEDGVEQVRETLKALVEQVSESDPYRGSPSRASA